MRSSRSDGPAPALAVTPPDAAPTPVRLLLADDEEAVLVTLAAVLRQAGYDVTEAHSAGEGRRLLSRSGFDVVVTDLQMETETSGLDLVRTALRIDPETVAIVLTGYGSFPSAVDSLHAGVFDYLTKPSNLDQLKGSIARGIEKRRLAQALLETERARDARLRAETHARQATLRAEISQFLAERDTLGAVLDRCAEALVRHLNVGYARIWVLNPGSQELELQGTAGVGTVSGPLVRTQLRMGEWKLGRAAVEQQPTFSEDLPNDPEFSDTAWAAREGMRFFAAYPMTLEGRTVGVVALFSRQPFAPATLDNMGPLASAMAQGIDRRRAEDERDRLLVAEREARRRAEATEHRLQQILETLPEGVLVIDATGRPLLWNAQAAAVAGPPDPELDVRNGSPAVKLADGSGAGPMETPLARAVALGETSQGVQMTLLNSVTGQPVPILINAAPLYDGDGQLLGAVAVFQDISGLKELEQQKLDFLSAAAHDLKTPLTSIKGMVQLLQRQLARLGGVSEMMVSTLASIDVAAGKMTSLIDQLLDVSQLDMTREIDLLRREVDLRPMLEAVLTQYRETGSNHEFVLNCSETSVVGSWDADRVERAVANLVANAVKYSPGGGQVAVSLERVREGEATWALIEVSDQGIGIPETDLQSIFERFHRAANVRGQIPGTGIGLAYVQEIVDRHGGLIAVESTEGRGSTFTVRLPL